MQIADLRAQLPHDTCDATANIMLQRYLEDLTSYAESIHSDGLDHHIELEREVLDDTDSLRRISPPILDLRDALTGHSPLRRQSSGSPLPMLYTNGKFVEQEFTGPSPPVAQSQVQEREPFTTTEMTETVETTSPARLSYNIRIPRRPVSRSTSTEPTQGIPHSDRTQPTYPPTHDKARMRCVQITPNIIIEFSLFSEPEKSPKIFIHSQISYMTFKSITQFDSNFPRKTSKIYKCNCGLARSWGLTRRAE